MAGLFASLFLIFLLIFGGVVFVRLNEQQELDRKRRTYLLDMSNVEHENTTELFRQVAATLRPKVSVLADLLGMAKAEQMIRGVPSLVFETWGTAPGGIRWLVKVPYGYEPLVRGRLEALIPGIRVQYIKNPPSRVFVHAVELVLNAGHRPLNIHNPVLTSVGVRTPFGQVAEEESLTLQFVITPMTAEPKPEHGTAKSKEVGFSALFRGMSNPSRDEITDRRQKLDEPNLLVAVRIGAVASSKSRAITMVSNVTAAFHATSGAVNYFKTEHTSVERVRDRITRGTTPLVPSVQLNAAELACLVGWPLGDVQVHGDPLPLSKRIPVPANVLDTGGIRLGVSNYSDRGRPVVLGIKESLVHQHILAPPGKGKTALLANEFRQIVNAGYGAVVIEQKGDLFHEALNYVPDKRKDDVIVFDVNDTKYPIAFNVLKDGPPALAVDSIDSIFRALYRDHPSLWANKAMYHGLMTLASEPDATVIDLLALLSPTGEEKDWARAVRNRVKSPELKRYFQDLEKDGKYKEQTMMEPIHNRFWTIMRSNLVNILGQSKSSFTMEEAITQNKIVLVNLSGIDTQAAELMGALIVSAMWKAAKAHPMPHSPNFLIMDEAHHFMKLPIDLGLMLVEARRFGVPMIFAHQGLYQLPPDMRQAVQQNMQTKIVMQTRGNDARDMASVFGAPITAYDIANLPQFGAIATVATPTGNSTPFTLSTDAPAKGYGNADRIIYASRGRYGRPANQVMDEILARRTVTEKDIPRTTRTSPRPFEGGLGF